MPVKGFNTDLIFHGEKFHVQSEDWGEDNPVFVSRVFCNGAVLESVKKPYDLKLFKRNYLDYEEVIQSELKKQHFDILEKLHLRYSGSELSQLDSTEG